MLHRLAEGLRSLLFPAACAGCQATLAEPSAGPLCEECLGQLPWVAPPGCGRCGTSLAGLGAGVDLCRSCRLKPPLYDQAASPFRYEGAAKELVLGLKFRGRADLAGPLGEWMAEAAQTRFGEAAADAVVPVPLHPARLRERTFNQAGLLARVVADRLHLPYLPDGLVRLKPTLPQTELARRERARNVRGAFAAKSGAPVRGKRLLLVDDILTTGSTAGACASALKRAGAAQVNVVTLAHG